MHTLCNDCGIIYDACFRCGEVLDNDDDYLCKQCEVDVRKSKCPKCGEVTKQFVDEEAFGDIYCSYCFHQTFEFCTKCKELLPIEQVDRKREPYMCNKCMKKHEVIY